MKAHLTEAVSAKAAFTLIELMVVIGLMAILGTISVTSYFAAVRGMSDRAAVQDTIALIRMARQVCLIDQTPTAVLFFNRRTDAEGGNGSVDPASGGTAIAVKMVGRISYIKGDILLDEFADWNQSYPMATGTAASQKDSTRRFFRMSNLKNSVGSGIDKCSSFVSTYVVPVDFDNERMIASGRQVYSFCEAYKKTGGDNRKFSGKDVDDGNNRRWGRQVVKSNGITWRVGDAYGVEIGILNLPKGYLYGTQAPNSPGKLVPVPSMSFDPLDATGYRSYDLDPGRSVKISALRPNGYKTIGTISKKDLSDEEQVKD